MRAIWLFTVAFIWAFQLDAAPKRDFISSGWQLPDGAAMVHFNGQESLFIPRGVALLGTEQLQEGILEVDISDDNARGFAGLVFHHNGQGTYEEVYLRLHKFGQPDALQYAPVFHNSASWVLYPEHQAVVQFQPSAWTHLKVVFQGNTARVYVNHATSPALLVPQLKVKDEPGAQIGLKALDGAYFTNFTFTPLAPSTPEATVTETAPPRTIMQWQLSNSFAVQGELAVPLALPQENKLTWQLVSTEASGKAFFAFGQLDRMQFLLGDVVVHTDPTM
ncbi:MAG: hypothetical protein ACO1OQ_15625, partial [Rufibacter sp.]